MLEREQVCCLFRRKDEIWEKILDVNQNFMQKDISKWFLAWKTDVDFNVQMPFTLTGEDWVPKHQMQSSRIERIFSREWLTSTNNKKKSETVFHSDFSG